MRQLCAQTVCVGSGIFTKASTSTFHRRSTPTAQSERADTTAGSHPSVEFVLQTVHHRGMPDSIQLEIDEAIALLSRTPAVLSALLRGLPGVWADGTEGQDTWSAFDIMGHLVCAERKDWMPRVQIVLEHGEAVPFKPFDRFEQAKETRNQTLDQILDDFACLRRDNLEALQRLHLQQKEMSLTGRHPVFGVVTLSQLLATWTVHDLTHLHQLSRVMAHQYRDLVGPWSAYLGVLQCIGHSAP